MRSLFLRIFLWFWVTMVVVAVALVVTSPFFTRSRPGVERWHQDGEAWVQRRLDSAARMVTGDGLDAADVPRPRPRGGRGGPSKIFVFKPDGSDARTQDAPKTARVLARQAAIEGREVSERRGGVYAVARPVVDPDGRPLVVVASVDRPPRPIDLLEPAALWPRLAVLALVVGAVSFALARYLARPFGALRETTRRLGVGDLSARVGGRAVHRRDEIGALARDFDAMAERLEGLVSSQRRLLRDVSHELRSPLARLRVALELARDRAGAAADEPLDRIEHEAARLDELIGQLLLLERLEAGQTGAEAVAFDLGQLLGEVVDDASFEAAPLGREVLVESGSSARSSGYPSLIRSALDNVIRNAIRHTPQGSSVEVTLAANDRGVSVAVRDHGPGVPDEHLETLFEPFSRVADARERATGGAGLGLAITRRAVEIHGGSVVARNHPEGGLEVVIHLPSNPA
jgi:two-component system sensor histidine kinase CpxA